MQLYYFMSADGRQLGPVPGEQLINCGITPDTLVWGQNMSGWIPANSVPEIVALFTSQPQPSIPQPSVKGYYFVGKDGQKLGPSTAEEVMNYGITPQTEVWCEGMTDWEEADKIPEFKALFDKSSTSELFRILPDGSVEMINSIDAVPSTERNPISEKSHFAPDQILEPKTTRVETEQEVDNENKPIKRGGKGWKYLSFVLIVVVIALGALYVTKDGGSYNQSSSEYISQIECGVDTLSGEITYLREEISTLQLVNDSLSAVIRNYEQIKPTSHQDSEMLEELNRLRARNRTLEEKMRRYQESLPD